MKTKPNKTRRVTHLATVAEQSALINECHFGVLATPFTTQQMPELLMEVASC